MKYAGILAGGIGRRMHQNDVPKQFLMLGDKPILIHTIEKFILCDKIDKIIVAVPEKWYKHSENLIKKYFENSRIDIVYGGNTRNDSILNICNFIQDNYGISEDDIILTHDSVRPFITQRIIIDNIEMIEKADAVDTVIPAYDTIVESVDSKKISSIPIRKNMYLGQTPQTFKIKTFKEIYCSLKEEEKNILTDACKMFLMNNREVSIVEGETYNIKITIPYDLKLASLILQMNDNLNK